MITAVTDAREIERCQNALARALSRQLKKKGTLLIGHPGGSFTGEVYSNNTLWFSSFKITDVPVKRYWNGFGLAIRQHGAQIIVVEINPPVRGYTAQVSGLFAKDNETGAYLLLHRGRIGGGRKGIGKNAFADWFRGKWVEVAASDSRVDFAILVARLESPNIADQILAFVNEVALFKEEATSGALTRHPRGPLQHTIFNPEFHGKKKGHRSGTLDYESFHGLVVNKLAEKVRLAQGRIRANIFNTRAIDLGVEIGRQLRQLYEVKSSADLQSLYSAIGQLTVHSCGEPQVTKTIVIPVRKLHPDLRKTISTLGFDILEYRIKGGSVEFTN